MQTSLSRRQRRRRNGSGHRPSSGGRAVAGIAIAIPLFLFASFLVAGAVGFAGVVAAFSYYSQGLPPPEDIDKIKFDQETRVYDRTGKVLLATFARERRDVVTFAEIPPVVIDATTSIEDKTFWENSGFDPAGIVSAALDTLSGNARGASTITQQLVRNRLLPESAFTTTYERKIREIIQSIRLTQAFEGKEGKQKIIAAYLNDNFYGNNSYGIAAAARGYWGVGLDKLTLAQAAILAAIPQSPSTYDLVRNAVEEELPDGSTQLVVPADAAVVQRRNRILELMKTRSVLTVGDYTTEDYDAAILEPVILTPPANRRIQAPHFVLQARSELGRILCGPDAADTCAEVDTGGFTVVTTLDWRLQRMAEKWTEAGARAPNAKDTAAYLKALGIPYQSWIKNMKGRGVHNAALAAVDYRTGQVYAYAGSAGFYLKGNKKFQPQFDVLEDGWRQPGSAFKPINYVIGLEDRTLTAATLFMDVVTDFGGGWTPVDADRLERGPLRLRQAIQVSLNIPAIKAAVRIGPDRVFQRARDFGIRSQFASNPAGAAIAIGTVEVHMIDLISAYGTIANGGVLVPRTTILEVRNAEGKKIWPLEGSKPTSKRVVSAQAAFIMTDILASNTDPAQNPFWSDRRILDGSTRRPAALKTGTTDFTQDLTAVGYLAPPKDPKAPALVVGAWMGNSDNCRAHAGHRGPRVGGVALAVLPDPGQQGHPDRHVPPSAGPRPGRGRREHRHEARPVHDEDGQGVVHRGHRADRGRQHQARHRGGRGDRGPLAGRLRRPQGGPRLPEPGRRRVRVPGVEEVQQRLARPRRARRGRRRRPGADEDVVLLRVLRLDAVREDLGRAVPAEEDVRDPCAVADADPLREPPSGRDPHARARSRWRARPTPAP